MNNRMRSIIMLSVSALVLNLAFQNCSKVKFEEVQPASETEPLGQPVTLSKVTNFEVPLTAKKQVDMLMVVDNSVSMEEEQAAMAAKFAGFISTLSSLDWRLAIITTQNESDAGPVSNCQLPGRDGCIMPFSNQHPWLDSSMSPAQTNQLFQDTIQMDADDTYTDERGIHAAYRFLQRYQGKENDFFRPDSHVVVIVISDEDERSHGYHPGNDKAIEQTDEPQFLIDQYTNILRPASFKAHGIITRPGDADCWFNGNGRWPGDIYEDLIVRTGGVVGDVCAEDYGNQLNDISRVIHETVSNIALECTPKSIPKVFMAESSPTVGGLSDNYVDVTTLGINLDPSVDGQEIRFGQALNPGDKIRIEYDCQ